MRHASCDLMRFHAAYFLPAAPRISVSREGESPPRPLRIRLAGPVPGECSRHAMHHTPPPSAVAPQPRVAPKAALHPRSSVRTTPSPSCDQVNPPDAGKTRTHRAVHAQRAMYLAQINSCRVLRPPAHPHRSRWRARDISRFRSTCSLHPMPAAWCVPSGG